MKWFFSMSKKDRAIMGVLAAVVIVLLIMGAVLMTRLRAGAAPGDESTVDEKGEYLLYLDYGSDFRYTYSMEYERNTADDGRITFLIPAGETAVFTIVPAEGKILKDVTIKAGTEKVKYQRDDNDISFTMPAHSVSVSPVTAVDTSYATPTPGPQEVTVEGITKELQDLMQGQYNEDLFLSNLGTALALDNPNSSYKDVAVISFTGEKVDTGIENTVGMVAILNHTTTRKVLVSYNTSSDVYSFTLNYVPTAPVSGVTAMATTSAPKPTQEPTKTPTPTPTPRPTSEPQQPAFSGNTGGSGSGGGGGYAPQADQEDAGQAVDPTVEEFISRFVLYEYPDSFSSYVDSEEFFNTLYDYVYSIDPNITYGTFDGFSIEGDFIKYSVTLSNGGVLNGTYDRTSGNFYY